MFVYFFSDGKKHSREAQTGKHQQQQQPEAQTKQGRKQNTTNASKHLPSPKLKQAQLRRDDFTNAEIARAWKAQKKKWDDGVFQRLVGCLFKR